jgi:hypothetical protein
MVHSSTALRARAQIGSDELIVRAEIVCGNRPTLPQGF